MFDRWPAPDRPLRRRATEYAGRAGIDSVTSTGRASSRGPACRRRGCRYRLRGGGGENACTCSPITRRDRAETVTMQAARAAARPTVLPAWRLWSISRKVGGRYCVPCSLNRARLTAAPFSRAAIRVAGRPRSKMSIRAFGRRLRGGRLPSTRAVGQAGRRATATTASWRAAVDMLAFDPVGTAEEATECSVDRAVAHLAITVEAAQPCHSGSR